MKLQATTVVIYDEAEGKEIVSYAAGEPICGHTGQVIRQLAEWAEKTRAIYPWVRDEIIRGQGLAKREAMCRLMSGVFEATPYSSGVFTGLPIESQERPLIISMAEDGEVYVSFRGILERGRAEDAIRAAGVEYRLAKSFTYGDDGQVVGESDGFNYLYSPEEMKALREGGCVIAEGHLHEGMAADALDQAYWRPSSTGGPRGRYGWNTPDEARAIAGFLEECRRAASKDGKTSVIVQGRAETLIVR